MAEPESAAVKLYEVYPCRKLWRHYFVTRASGSLHFGILVGS